MLNATLYSKLKEFKYYHKMKVYSQKTMRKMQKETIEKYIDDNEIIDDAVQKIKSVSKSLVELSKINDGYAKYLPRKNDKRRNHRIRDLEKIIKVPTGIKSRGILFPDNPITVASFYAVGLAAYNLIVPESQEYFPREFIDYTIPIIASLIPVPFRTMKFETFKSSLEQAWYIDKKIERFYKK